MPILGKITPATTDIVHLYTVPAGKNALVTFSAVNTSDTNTTVSLYLQKQDDLSVASINVVKPGSGLANFPDITVVGDGNPSAKAKVTALTLTGVSLTGTDTDFEKGDTVVFSVNNNEYVTLRILEVSSTGGVEDYEIVDGGTITAIPDKLTVPQASTTGKGKGLGIDVSSMEFGIKVVEITDSGNNYTTTPTVEVSDGEGFEYEVQMKPASIQITDAIEHKIWLDEGGVVERTGLLLGSGDSLFVEGKVNALLLGIESLA